MEYIEYELLRIREQKKNFGDIILSCVQELENDIRKAIKKRWLKAESVNGGSITNQSTGNSGYARLSYKKLKLEKNPASGGKIDLTFSGALGDKIEIIKSSNGNFEIISTDPKYYKIGDMYGFDEFGLSDDEMSYFMKLLEDKINTKL